MTLNIYQTQPRLVFSAGGKVYKFFNTAEECRFEVESIMSSPMIPSLDSQSEHTMALVEIISSHDLHYVMKVAEGDSLASSNDYNGYYLAGRWLKTFHESSKETVGDDVLLFGDYVASHLYIDNVNKEVTLIDPGKDFGRVGNIEEDIARFIVGLFHTKDFDFRRLRNNISQFICGYGVELLDYYLLESFIEFRIKRSFEKTMGLSTRIKNVLLAFVWRTIGYIKHRVIKNQLKEMLNGS